MSSPITYREYWQEIRSLVAQASQQAKDDLTLTPHEHLTEIIDNHQWVIYTYYNLQVLQHSNNMDYTREELGLDASSGNSMFWAQLAYGAMLGDCLEELHTSDVDQKSPPGDEQ